MWWFKHIAVSNADRYLTHMRQLITTRPDGWRIPDIFYTKVSGAAEKETSHTRQSPSSVMDIPDTVKASAVRYTVLSSGQQAVEKDIVITAWGLLDSCEAYHRALSLLEKAMQEGFSVYVPQNNGSLRKVENFDSLLTALQTMSGKIDPKVLNGLNAKDQILYFDQKLLMDISFPSTEAPLTPNRLKLSDATGFQSAKRLVSNFPEIYDVDVSGLSEDRLVKWLTPQAGNPQSPFEELCFCLNTNAKDFGGIRIDLGNVAKLTCVDKLLPIFEKFQLRGVGLTVPNLKTLKGDFFGKEGPCFLTVNLSVLELNSLSVPEIASLLGQVSAIEQCFLRHEIYFDEVSVKSDNFLAFFFEIPTP